MIKKKTTYTLIKKDVPEMKGRRVVTDARVGGEKLVYQRVTMPFKVKNILGLFNITVPLMFYRKRSGGIGVDREIDTVIYLRPYKKNWALKKDREPFHLWGKKEHPLTNIWVELEYDYEDITRSTPLIRTRLDDNENILLIKFLRKHEEKFTIIN
jgi:hypothetical protein